MLAVQCLAASCPHPILSSCTLCRWYELKCKNCSEGKVGDVKTSVSGLKAYRRVNPECGILYRVGPYVQNGRVNVTAKPGPSSISGTSSHNTGSQVFAWLFARLFVFARLFGRLLVFARLFARL